MDVLIWHWDELWSRRNPHLVKVIWEVEEVLGSAIVDD